MGQRGNWNWNWNSRRFRNRFEVFGLVVMSLLCQSFHLCWCLNDEGLALLKFRERIVNDPFAALSDWNDHKFEVDPCNWFGVECSDGKVVALNLKDLCLEGTLAPELKNLVHMKSIIVRNNSFTGIIPEGIGGLEELEVLDLGYNNFRGPLPDDLGSNLSLGILLLDNNKHLGSLSPEIYELQLLSEFQVDENQLSNICDKQFISFDAVQRKESAERRQLQVETPQLQSKVQLLVSQTEITPAASPALPPPPTGSSEIGVNGTTGSTNSSFHSPNPSPTPHPSLTPHLTPPASIPRENPSSTRKNSSSRPKLALVVVGSIGAAIFVIGSLIGIYLWTSNKAAVGPWATGLSGQLQKAFVTGVPNLKRPELEAACEDFSNVIGFSPMGPVYKGTLSSGVEIAVANIPVKSSKDWSNTLELQFRKKIDTLSKLNHKNFVNLIGYCEEEEPFGRMMVFEYAPNGTLYEHLHDEDFEHLDWRMRLRIAMGITYCLEYIHEQNPPIIQLNLTSSAINLTEDYAAKIAECSLQNEMVVNDMISVSGHLLNTSSGGPESHIYSFGLILLELMTGKTPHSSENGSLEEWAIQFLKGDQPLKELVDPTLASFQQEQLEQIGQLLRSCLHSNPAQRSTMRHISTRLRSITGITPDEAIPRLSPLWWAELEIASSEGR